MLKRVMQHLSSTTRAEIQAQVRLCAGHRIKRHASLRVLETV